MATYLITGANRGIGLEYCRQLKKFDHQIIATCRESSEALNNLNVRVEENIDISSGDSVLGLLKRLQFINIDVMILNAGIYENNSLELLNPESILRQFEVNALSPLCMVKTFLKRINSGGKIILMTSRMGSIQDNTSGGSYGYRMSKVALCMAGKSLAIDLKAKNISVAILHPGLVSTRMTGFTPNGISTDESVSGLLSVIDNLNLQNSGSFWHANGQILPW